MKYTKTELGQAAFKARSPLFSARQRATFILIDGSKTLQHILTAAASLGVIAQDLHYMEEQGFIVGVAPTIKPGEPGSTQWVSAEGRVAERSDLSEQERYTQGKMIATQLTAGLGLRGFRLNLQVESVAGFDELLALLPKLQEAAGVSACRDLERVLRG